MHFSRPLLRLSSAYRLLSLRQLGPRTLPRLSEQILPPCSATQSVLVPKNIYRFTHEDKSNKTEPKSQDSLGKNEAPSPSDSEPKTITQAQRLRKIFAEYGSIGVGFHVCISLTSLGICYTAVSSGLDVPELLNSIGLSKGLSDSAFTTGASTFVIAYACHKFPMPFW